MGSGDDPFSWDGETLAVYLGRRLPIDSDKVRTIVQEGDVDGSTFLRYSKFGTSNLCRLFGITGLKAELALFEAVEELQTSSDAYQALLLKKHAVKGSVEVQMGDAGPVATNEPDRELPHHAKTTPQLNGSAQHTNQAGLAPSSSYSPSYSPSAAEPSLIPSFGVNTDPEIRNGVGSTEARAKSKSPSGGSDDQQAAKRRRIAPTALQTRPEDINPAFLPPEKMIPRADMARFDSHSLASVSKGAYLGEGYVHSKDLMSNDVPAIIRVSELGDGGFRLAGRTIPPGRRLVVKRAMRRLFVANGRREDALKQGYELSASEHNSDDDDIISLASELDAETLREMAEDKAEDDAAASCLTREEAGAILDEFITARITHWRENKLPKKDRKAWELWTSAARSRRAKITAIQRDLRNLDERMRRFRKDFLDNVWPSREELLSMARTFEQTIDDRCVRDWEFSILDSRHPPPFVAASKQSRARKDHIRQVDGEGELLLSSDDESIVADDENVPAVDEGEAPTFETMDLTQLETPSKSMFYIDLTQVEDTPVKMRAAKEEPERMDLDVQNSTAEPAGSSVNVRLLKGTNPEEQFHNNKLEGICSALWKLTHADRMAVFDLSRRRPEEAWQAAVKSLSDETPLGQNDNSFAQAGAVEMLRLFYMFAKSTFTRQSSFLKRLRDTTKMSKLFGLLKKYKAHWWPLFIGFLRQVASQYPTDAQIFQHARIYEQISEASDVEDMLDDPETDAVAPSRRSVVATEVVLDQGAMDFRDREQAFAEELEERRRKLRQQMASQPVSMSENSPRLIINEGKKDGEGFIYVNDHIAPTIKDHQIDGVRFLWDSVIRDKEQRTGGLLAHTMGLGKTMQVITFLIAVQEAARSQDPTVHSQIPSDLKNNKTLIVCPAALVNNWLDELLIWDPTGHLKPLRKIDTSTPIQARGTELQRWADGGGVLVTSYNILVNLIDPDKKSKDTNRDKIRKLWCDTPNIVVADEAHKIKNRSGSTNRACQLFSTKSRIALTGSPLANDVGEYFSMIDWTVPGFLGDYEEFQKTYGTPVERGLYRDSSGSEKKKAIKMLRVLTGTIKSKVHRRTVAALKHEMPNKNETVIFLEPTELQTRLYNEWIRIALDGASAEKMSGFLFAVLELLRLTCNHPKCLQHKFQNWKQEQAAGKRSAFHEDSPEALFQPIANKLMATEPDMMSEQLSRKTTCATRLLDEARAAGEKVLLFSTSIETLNYLEQLFKSQKRQCSRLDGKVQAAKRQAQVKQFNNDNTEVFLISTKAGGVGLNIQGACRVIIFDTKFNPVDEQQAIGRAYRIGQKKPVHVYRFVMAGTFEDDLHNRSIFKTQLASRVVDERKPLTWAKRRSQLIHETKKVRNQDLAPFRGKDPILDKLIDTNTDNTIKHLISWDTFEEEDLEDLSQQERQEADDMIKQNHRLNRLRQTDPVAAEREKARIDAERAASLYAEQMIALRPSDSSGAPFSNGLSTQPPLGAATGSNHKYPPSSAIAASHDNSRLLSYDGASESPPVHANAIRPSPAGVGDTLKHQTIGGPVPPPMVGANTYIGTQPSAAALSTAQTPLDKTASPASAPVSAPSAKGFPFTRPRAAGKDNFRRELLKRCDEVRATRPGVISGDAGEIASRLTDKIESRLSTHLGQQGLGFLEEGQRWEDLQKLLANDKTLCAVVNGHMTAEFLAESSGKDLRNRAETLQLEDFAVLARAPERGQDSSRTSGSMAGRLGQSSRDDEVMRAVAKKRLQRRDSERTATPERHSGVRLPQWGYDELATQSPRSTPGAGP